MIHASDDNETTATLIEAVAKFRPIMTWIAAVPSAARTLLHGAELAHASRCKPESVSAKVVRDSGLDPSDATGIAAWKAELPFFMQKGFGRR